MKACEASWNYHVQEDANARVAIGGLIMEDPTGAPDSIGTVSGTKYTFSGNAAADEDACGWYFIPSGALAQQQASAINQTMPAFTKAGNEIVEIIPPSTPGTERPISITVNSKAMRDAIAQYRKAAIIADGMPTTSPPKLNLKSSSDATSRLRKMISDDMTAFDYLFSAAP